MNDLERKNRIREELNELESNQAALATAKETSQKMRADTKEFWASQLQATTQQRQKEKDADEVLKKQIAV